MEKSENTCRNCCYAFKRDDAKFFSWCDYECTFDFPPEERSHIAYKRDIDSCSHFLKTDKNM